jgi:hypothetical protein
MIQKIKGVVVEQESTNVAAMIEGLTDPNRPRPKVRLSILISTPFQARIGWFVTADQAELLTIGRQVEITMELRMIP